MDVKSIIFYAEEVYRIHKKNKSTNENVTTISVSVFRMLMACGTNELLYDQKVDGEETVCVFFGKNWVSVRYGPEESSTVGSWIKTSGKGVQHP